MPGHDPLERLGLHLERAGLADLLCSYTPAAQTSVLTDSVIPPSLRPLVELFCLGREVPEADLDPVTGEVMLLDLNFPEHRNDEWDTIEGIELQTCSARLLAARLSLLDPPAYFNPPCVEWPKAHMAFFVFEDVPRTICWYKA